METAKFIEEVIVVDPDTKGNVHLSIFKHSRGGMFCIDSSYIEQVLPEEGKCFIPDPFDTHSETNVFKNIKGVELIGID